MTIPLDTTVRGDVLDVLRELPAESVQCCVTSPPYFHARDDGLPPRAWGGFCYTPAVNVPPIHIPAQCCCLGRETSPEAFVGHLVLVFSEVRRVLKSGGLLWLVLGDAYARNGGPRSGPGAHAGNTAHGIQSAVTVCPDGYRENNLIPISWRTALALQADGWLLRTANVWAKPNAMPEPVQDRTVKAHEYVFALTKAQRYQYHDVAVREPAVGSGSRTLRAMHDRLSASGMNWADQLEMVYIAVAALRCHDPVHATHPYRGRGPGEHLRVITLHTDWVVHRVVLRDRGIILAGPPPTTLIAPISMDELHSVYSKTQKGEAGRQ